MENEKILLGVSDFVALTNQTLEYAYQSVAIEGEVANFKVNQGKYVFFDLKDDEASVGCFMTVWQLRTPIEDGMKIIVRATPKLTPWGKFSLTVQAIQPKGEGAIKKTFELLQAKLEKEGLFAEKRKRPLPASPTYVGVISSTQAAGYGDFMKIAGDRWGGVRFDVAHVQVQGAGAADQIIAAIKYFGELEQPPEVLVLVRGGGSADDLAVFSDELLVREIAASRVPVLTGIGHEIDVTLADLVSDRRASTPTNAAMVLLPDKAELQREVRYKVRSLLPKIERAVAGQEGRVQRSLASMAERTEMRLDEARAALQAKRLLLRELNPAVVLQRGYAILRGAREVGALLNIETNDEIVTAEVKDVKTK